jgi:hypothetical protein
MSKNMSDIEEIIKIVENLISNFDPIPSSSKKAQFSVSELREIQIASKIESSKLRSCKNF